MPVDIAAILEVQERGVHSPRSRRLQKLRAVRARRIDELTYRRDLMAIVNRLMVTTQRILFPVLRRLEPTYLLDASADPLADALSAIAAEFNGLEAYAEEKATGMVERMDKAHARRFFKGVEEIIGIDLGAVVQSEGLEFVIKAKIHENTKDIVSIAEKHLGELEKLVYEKTIQGRTSAVSLEKAIMELGVKTKWRAKFIARDQTAKTNAALNTQRNLALGIEEYVWHATGGKIGDGRTRKTHREKHGNVYRYDSPPADTGHPGEDYQCRCVAHSLIPGALPKLRPGARQT